MDKEHTFFVAAPSFPKIHVAGVAAICFSQRAAHPHVPAAPPDAYDPVASSKNLLEMVFVASRKNLLEACGCIL